MLYLFPMLSRIPLGQIQDLGYFLIGDLLLLCSLHTCGKVALRSRSSFWSPQLIFLQLWTNYLIFCDICPQLGREFLPRDRLFPYHLDLQQRWSCLWPRQVFSYFYYNLCIQPLSCPWLFLWLQQRLSLFRCLWPLVWIFWHLTLSASTQWHIAFHIQPNFHQTLPKWTWFRWRALLWLGNFVLHIFFGMTL